MDLVSIAEAAREFHKSQASLYKALSAGWLTRYRIPLDRRTYLDRGQLKKLLSEPEKERRPPSR